MFTVEIYAPLPNFTCTKFHENTKVHHLLLVRVDVLIRLLDIPAEILDHIPVAQADQRVDFIAQRKDLLLDALLLMRQRHFLHHNATTHGPHRFVASTTNRHFSTGQFRHVNHTVLPFAERRLQD